MENLSTLTGKYGDEGDQLLFKVLNSGDFLSKRGKTLVGEQELEKGYKHVTPIISEKGLRYDLTVPFARYVVMNRNDISFPFKRYQIQPVWRADRPQRGRYREFYQCDADVVGTKSLICEAEIVLMITEVFGKLGIEDYSIKINNRKILSGITEVIGAKGHETDLCVAIDKLDKIGEDKVLEELTEKGFSDEAIENLRPILHPSGSSKERLARMEEFLTSSETGLKGIEETRKVYDYVAGFGLENAKLEFDMTLARGLNYYTGAIFEVKVNNVSIGSVSGGGRYDDLTGVFGLPDVPGVGFSFGVDRIYDVMEELELFPEQHQDSTKVMICNFDEESERYSLKVLSSLRQANINAEIYPDQAKMKKQMTFANNKEIPFVLMVGSQEMASGKLTLKDMKSGEQEGLSVEELIEKLK